MRLKAQQNQVALRDFAIQINELAVILARHKKAKNNNEIHIIFTNFFKTTIVTFGQQKIIDKQIDSLISTKTTKPFNLFLRIF